MLSRTMNRLNYDKVSSNGIYFLQAAYWKSRARLRRRDRCSNATLGLASQAIAHRRFAAGAATEYPRAHGESFFHNRALSFLNGRNP